MRDEAELPLARGAIAGAIPLLGICRGTQVINVALGGSLHPDHSALPSPADRHRGGDWDIWEEVVKARLEGGPPPKHPSHEILIAADSRLASALGGDATVNSYHHQSIATLRDGVVVAATAPDGVIEAIEVPAAPALCIGVQWELQEEPSSPLLALFVEAAAERAAARLLTRAGVADHRQDHAAARVRYNCARRLYKFIKAEVRGVDRRAASDGFRQGPAGSGRELDGLGRLGVGG